MKRLMIYVWSDAAASILTGVVVTTAMNPMDVVSTRIYSQKVVNGKGKLYSGVVDCIMKTMKSEGLRGFLQGLDGALHAARPAHHIHLPLLGGGQEDRGRTRILMCPLDKATVDRQDLCP